MKAQIETKNLVSACAGGVNNSGEEKGYAKAIFPDELWRMTAFARLDCMFLYYSLSSCIAFG